jgi:hypothetical protein
MRRDRPGSLSYQGFAAVGLLIWLGGLLAGVLFHRHIEKFDVSGDDLSQTRSLGFFQNASLGKVLKHRVSERIDIGNPSNQQHTYLSAFPEGGRAVVADPSANGRRPPKIMWSAFFPQVQDRQVPIQVKLDFIDPHFQRRVVADFHLNEPHHPSARLTFWCMRHGRFAVKLAHVQPLRIQKFEMSFGRSNALPGGVSGTPSFEGLPSDSDSGSHANDDERPIRRGGITQKVIPVWRLLVGALCLGIACGTIGNSRKSVRWFGFAVIAVGAASILGGWR